MTLLRILLVAVIVLLLPLIAKAQGGTTLITGRVLDPFNIPYINSQVNISFFDPGTSHKLPLINGSVFQKQYVVQTDSNGYILTPVALPDNGIIAGSSGATGTQWTFRVIYQDRVTSFTTNITINCSLNQPATCSSNTIDVTATLQAAAAPIPTIGGGSGTVTSVSAGGFAPLFTTSVASPTTTPTISNTAISQNANTVYAGPSGTATDLVDFSVPVATGTASPISISATPKQSGDLAIVFSVRDGAGNAPNFTPDVSWTAGLDNNATQRYFYKNISGLATATASGAIGSTSPNWAAALALFTATPTFTPVVTNQSVIQAGSWNSFTNQVIGFTPTAGRTLIVSILGGQQIFGGGLTGLVSFTDSVGDVFVPITQVSNGSGQGTQLWILAATNIVGGVTTFSNIMSGGGGITNGTSEVFEVTNLSPVTSTFGPMTVRQIIGKDLPYPTKVSLGGIFSKAPIANRFLTSVNLDGTLGQAQPSFADLSSLIAPAQVPATTSNCTGTNFAQGLNAGLTPICTASPTAIIIQAFSNKTLASNVAASANTVTTIDSITMSAFPAACTTNGCRIRVNYSYYVNGGVFGLAWADDGTNTYAQSMCGTLNNNFSICSTSMLSPTQFSSGATPTIAIKFDDNGAATICTNLSGAASPCTNAPTNTPSIASRMEVEVIVSP